MMIYDDYSNSYFYSETDPRQKPILSPEEIKQLRKEYKEFWFYFHLMQWGTYWNSIMLDPPREQKTISIDDIPEWLEQMKAHIEQDRKYLIERKQ
ncbi:MAG: hypothetical protein K5852_05090 [Eubacterium sp.]|nr:hypothetical protein [Eubacterium sp.]